MRKGVTLIEILVVVCIVTILGGLIYSAIMSRSNPQVVAIQPLGTTEASGARTVVKVHYSQIESYLAAVPGNTRIVAVVPIYTGTGKTFDIGTYLVVLERNTKGE